MERTPDGYTEQLSFGTLSFGQHDNGIYHAEIKHNDGDISATIRDTMTEIKQWVHEQIHCYHAVR